MKKLFSLFVLVIALAVAPLAFGQGSAGVPPNTAAYWSPLGLEAVYGAPEVTWTATGLTLTYTAGTIYPGTTSQAITAGTLTLTDAKGTCTVAALFAQNDACNYVYWSTGTSLSTTTAASTVETSGYVPLYACKTSGGNITGCVAFSVLSTIPVTNHLLTSPVIINGQTAAAATLSPTCAANSGQTILVGATAGEVVTLPTPAAGCWFKFIFTVSNTSNSNEIQTAASQFLLGSVSEGTSAGAVSLFLADGTSTRALKCNGTTTGGLAGGVVWVEGTSATVWHITGTNVASGVIATPFTGTP